MNNIENEIIILRSSESALRLFWKCSEKKVRKRVLSLEAQTRTNEAKIIVLYQTWSEKKKLN